MVEVLKHYEKEDICKLEAREQMNIVVVGHVDHGKSTVIGRLMADTDSLPEGKLESVKEYCKKNARPFEYAFLLDALKDEQAQGITIDTARCFFKTNKRDYIIIDAPGHIEFLKNMVTGASRAEAALLVIDAKEGIKENSKRHGHIVSMLGIKQVVVLVNKMDLIDFDFEIFSKIKSEFTEFLGKINITPIDFIPISAFNGDNIANMSNKSPWYKGLTVLQQMDAFENKEKSENQDFRMSVQDIYKFTKEGDDRRIVAGTISSGSIHKGDEVLFLPSYKKSVVESIEGFNVKPRDTAFAGEAIGITLKTQIYITPGELMIKANDDFPFVSSKFKANIFWVGKSPLVKNKNYKLKIGTMKIDTKLVDVLNIIDAAELNINKFKDQVERHDVAECVFETVKPIAFDVISNFEQSGRFVIVDNYEISGGGIILESISDVNNSLKEHIKEREFHWDKSLINELQRKEAYGHKSKFIVLTSGNESNENTISTIGRKLEKTLFDMKYKSYYLGVSSLISGISSEFNISFEDRHKHIRQLGELARILTDSGQIFITSIFNIDDYEAQQLKLLNQPNDILVINIGESPFINVIPDANVEIENAVDEICKILVNKDIIIEYYI